MGPGAAGNQKIGGSRLTNSHFCTFFPILEQNQKEKSRIGADNQSVSFWYAN